MKSKIMIVGTQHYHEIFKYSNPDEQFLESVNRLRDSLSRFQPTRVCIEQEAKIQKVINESFGRYNSDIFYKNEAYDLGFYIAKNLNLDSVVAMDWMEQDSGVHGMNDIYEWAQNNDLSFIELIEEIQLHHDEISKLNDSNQITLKLNKPQNYRMDEKSYGQMMLLGDN